MRKSKNKHKRKSGFVTPKIVDKSMKYSDIVEDCLEPQPYYDDWLDWRDGMRDDHLLIFKLRDKLKELHTPKKVRNRKLKDFVNKRFFWKTIEI